MGTVQLRNEWEDARKDQVSLPPSAAGGMRDKPSTWHSTEFGNAGTAATA